MQVGLLALVLTRRAGKLTFKVGERGDDLRGLVRPVAPCDVDLFENTCVDELRHRVVCGWVGAPDQCGGAAHRYDWSTYESGEEKVGGRVLADCSEASAPCVLDASRSHLKITGISDRPRTGDRELLDPSVHLSVRLAGGGWTPISDAGQRVDVVLCPGCQDERYGWKDPNSDTPTSEDEVDESTTGSAVVVHKWMNGLELSVGDG